MMLVEDKINMYNIRKAVAENSSIILKFIGEFAAFIKAENNFLAQKKR